jgi:predicted RNA-binding Zn-ribbon protein involved in translation (DUF1610 family)
MTNFATMDRFVLVKTFDDYVSAHIALGRLEEDGIRGWLKDEHSISVNPVLSNALGGIKLMVLHEDAERAAGILRSIVNEARASHPCPNCGSLNIEHVTTPRKASNWLSMIFGFFTAGVTMPIEKMYHCFNCGHEYPDETPVTEND